MNKIPFDLKLSSKFYPLSVIPFKNYLEDNKIKWPDDYWL